VFRGCKWVCEQARDGWNHYRATKLKDVQAPTTSEVELAKKLVEPLQEPAQTVEKK